MLNDIKIGEYLIYTTIRTHHEDKSKSVKKHAIGKVISLNKKTAVLEFDGRIKRSCGIEKLTRKEETNATN
jgi:hypothetical protein